MTTLEKMTQTKLRIRELVRIMKDLKQINKHEKALNKIAARRKK